MATAGGPIGTESRWGRQGAKATSRQRLSPIPPKAMNSGLVDENWARERLSALEEGTADGGGQAPAKAVAIVDP